MVTLYTQFLSTMLNLAGMAYCLALTSLVLLLMTEVTIKQKSVVKSQIGLLSSRRLLENLKYYQADDVTSHKRLSYLERLCFAIPCFRIVFGGDRGYGYKGVSL